MTASGSSSPERRFDTEAGTPELGARSEPPAGDAAPTAAAPGLVGVATLSLAPPRESGVCRCGACLALPEDVDAWFK